jgi:N-acylneuraminate cytidylyltransferase
VSEERVLAVVPARGGSKSIPRKNVRPLGGHPLLAWSIAAALAAREVSDVLVSTDDEEIAETARDYGAAVPFLRPASLAQDDTPDLPVFEHALLWLERHRGDRPGIVVQVRPTSPLRPPGLLDEGVRLLARDPGAHALRAVTMPSQNPYKMWTLAGRYLAPLFPLTQEEPWNMPRQQLPVTFWQTGHLDIARRDTILRDRSMTGQRVVPLVVEPAYAVDIDTEEHWAFAEWLVAKGTLELVRPQPGRTRVPV